MIPLMKLNVNIKYSLNNQKIIVILLSRQKTRAKKRPKFGISWLNCTTQTPPNISVSCSLKLIFSTFSIYPLH